VRILITGTSGGIGGAVKRAAVAAGHEVVDLNRDGFVDLSESLSDGLLPFDGVVFASGVCPVKPLTRMSDEEFLEVFEVNCLLFLKLMRRIVKAGLYSPSGMKVAAISSVSAREGWPGGSAYCASKGALSAACRALDAELAPRKISVKAIEPHHVRTAMFERCAGRMGVSSSEALDPELFAKDVLSMLER
jgi:NAD(P)-dependent dehydrogenase (short-subunit alcohol dehydrogenase family)